MSNPQHFHLKLLPAAYFDAIISSICGMLFSTRLNSAVENNWLKTNLRDRYTSAYCSDRGGAPHPV
jgi:hypothetical protein